MIPVGVPRWDFSKLTSSMRTDAAACAGSQVGEDGVDVNTGLFLRLCVASSVEPFNGIAGTDWDCDNTRQTDGQTDRQSG